MKISPIAAPVSALTAALLLSSCSMDPTVDSFSQLKLNYLESGETCSKATEAPLFMVADGVEHAELCDGDALLLYFSNNLAESKSYVDYISSDTSLCAQHGSNWVITFIAPPAHEPQSMEGTFIDTCLN